MGRPRRAAMHHLRRRTPTIVQALVRIAHPIVSEAIANQDFGKVQEIYTKSGNILFLLGSFVFLLVWSNRYSIENFLDPIYAQGIWVIFFIGLAHLTEVASSINYQIIAVTPYYRFNLFMGVLSITLLILTNFLFIQIYGLVGVAIGSLISLVLVNLLRHVFLWKRYQLNPFSLKTLKIAALWLVFFLLFEYLPNMENLYLNAVVRSAILALTFLPLAYLWQCSQDFNDIVNKYLTKFNLPTPR
jgi:O-antigen/teichoic acid export membrane protein